MKPAMVWVVLLVVVAAVAVLMLYLRSNGPKRPANPSVIVDMDDQPRTEIDFDAGIRANQKALKPKDKA